jgi:hypothetical protein
MRTPCDRCGQRDAVCLPKLRRLKSSKRVRKRQPGTQRGHDLCLQCYAKECDSRRGGKPPPRGWLYKV